MSINSGFPSSKLEHRTDAKNVTVEPVRDNQAGFTTVAYAFLREVASLTIVSAAANAFELSAASAQIGDFISVTSGAAAGFQSKVIAVSGATVLLADTPSVAPSASDSVDVLRHNMPRVNAAGELLTSGGGSGTAAATLATIVDEVSASITYLGKADPGTATASALWQIQRITTSGTTTTVQFADGNSDFDNVWNNRASLSYS